MHFIKRAHYLGLESSSVLILLGLSFLSTITEIFGVAIFLPIFQFINVDGDINLLVSESEIWEKLVFFYKYIGIEVNLTVLLISTFTLFLMRQVFIYLRLIYYATIRTKMIKKVSFQLLEN